MDILTAYEAHLMHRGLRPSSRRKIMLSLRAFTKSFLFWDQLGAREVNDWLDARELAPRTRYWWLSTLHRFYEWAVDEGHCSSDPTRRAVRPKCPPLAARPVQRTDIAAVMFMTPAGPMRTMLALMRYGGLRCMEVAGLRWSHVDDTAGWLRIEGKGAKVRFVPISPKLASLLPARARPNDPVIGATWSPADVSDKVAAHLRRCGLEATAHQLRHTFATELYAQTGNIRAVQKILGHASIATTEIYVGVPDAMLMAAVEHIGRGDTVDLAQWREAREK
jgi:integrase/recombinase XerD